MGNYTDFGTEERKAIEDALENSEQHLAYMSSSMSYIESVNSSENGRVQAENQCSSHGWSAKFSPRRLRKEKRCWAYGGLLGCGA